MSLILDALKKSEAERQRGQAPNLLSPLPSSPKQLHANTKSGLPWLIVLVLLLGILLIGFFYLKEKTQDSSSVTPSSTTEIPQQPRVMPPVKIETPTIATPASAPTEKPTPTVASAAAPVVASPVITPVPVETPTSIVAPEPVARIASLSEMAAEQRQQLPTLKLSMHVYSADAAKRFAIIDGQRINEGSVLGNAVVEQIRADGVVLSVQGQAYLLPRP